MVSAAYELGMVGLGVMGSNFLLNVADHGHSVAGFDRDPAKVDALLGEAQGRRVAGARSVDELIGSLERPRIMVMLVPAGPPVDGVIRELLPSLAPGDLLVDGGNSYFEDTKRRQDALAKRRIAYLGVGISGGEYGARHGPCLMPGGDRQAYERLRVIFEAIAARVGGDPCVTYLGPDAAGHYVKMVHNGIEYAIMQLISETYDLMKRGMGLSDEDLHSIYERWDQTELKSFLIEITAEIFTRVDEKTGKRLIDVILDEAKQLGTGRWSSQNAMDLQVPTPNIDTGVMMRTLSMREQERQAAAGMLAGPPHAYRRDRPTFVDAIRSALYTGVIASFAQGMALLRAASGAHGYGLNLEDIARIWRGGCIIRSEVLGDIQAAFHARPDLPNLLLDPRLGQALVTRQARLRAVVSTAAGLGIPVPGMAAALAYFDAYRSAWLPANLVQAQRDYFGAHDYERVDAKGEFHTEWREN